MSPRRSYHYVHVGRRAKFLGTSLMKILHAGWVVGLIDTTLSFLRKSPGTPWRTTPVLCPKSSRGLMNPLPRTAWPERDWVSGNVLMGGMSSDARLNGLGHLLPVRGGYVSPVL